jgi:hypothetical protein
MLVCWYCCRGGGGVVGIGMLVGAEILVSQDRYVGMLVLL